MKELDGHRYLLYDADRSEGFNLRRDVYIRMAELTLDLGSNWTLVLPPWTRMPHWTKRKDTEVRTKRPLSWSTFFNVHALQEVVPVIEFDTFIDHVANQIDLVLVLNQFDDVFSTSDITSEEASSTSFDRFEPTECDAMHNVPYEKHRDAEGLDHVHGSFYGFFSQSVRAARLACARMDGTTRTLRKAILERYLDAHTLFIHNAHVPLHAQYGDARFWLIRRSMQFSERVLRYADEFRLQHFDSDDSRDKTFIGDDWILEKTKRERKPGDALGGEYVAVHLRRGDFKKATDAVSVSDAIAQSFVALRKFNATKLFVACDCDADDWQQLQRQFEQSKKAENQIYELFRYQNDRLSDGELAIVDQWICAHAKAFIGKFILTTTQQSAF